MHRGRNSIVGHGSRRLGFSLTGAFFLQSCSVVLSLGDYNAGTVAAEAGDVRGVGATADGGGPPDGETDSSSCDADITSHCYACAPTTPTQFLNACTSGTCVPFDDTRLTHLLADGGLPAVPVK